MINKIEQIQELLNIPNIDSNTETAIANMKILNLLVDLRSDIEQFSLNGVSHRRELLIATLYGWQDYNEQGISIEDYVDEIESNL